MPRAYIHHATATVRHLKQNYRRQPMHEIAAELGIPARKLYSLAYREGIKKERPTD